VNGEGEALCESRLKPRPCLLSGLESGLDLSCEVAELIDQRLNASLHHSRNVLQLLRGEGGGGRGMCGLGVRGGYKPSMKAARGEPQRGVLNDRRDYTSK
jgi:hypothetical protein